MLQSLLFWVLSLFAIGEIALAQSAGDDQFCLGQDFGCRLINGRPHCWGYFGHYGGLKERQGDYYTADESGESAQPLVISGGKKLFCGQFLIYMLTAENEIVCHGYDRFGECARGVNRTTRVDITDGMLLYAKATVAANMTAKLLSAGQKAAGIVPVYVAGGREFTCFLLSNARVKCAGKNDRLQLGRNGPVSITDVEGQIPYLQMNGQDLIVSKISCKRNHCAAWTVDSKLITWGNNDRGALGNGDSTDSLPMEVNLKNNTDNPSTPICQSVIDVQVGDQMTCILCSDSQLRCWGNNAFGQVTQDVQWDSDFGDDPTEMSPTRVPIIVNVGTGLNVTRMTLDRDAMCAGLHNGRWKCFGKAILNGRTTSTDTEKGDAVDFVNLGKYNSSAVLMKSGRSNQCFLANDGKIFCFGKRRVAGTSDAYRGAAANFQTDAYVGDDAAEMGNNLKEIVFVASAFTYANSMLVLVITLGLSMFVV